jgi:hypothetical protein
MDWEEFAESLIKRFRFFHLLQNQQKANAFEWKFHKLKRPTGLSYSYLLGGM